jgi:hypothetical protein
MDGRHLVPNHEVAGAPPMLVDELGAHGEFEEVFEELRRDVGPDQFPGESVIDVQGWLSAYGLTDHCRMLPTMGLLGRRSVDAPGVVHGPHVGEADLPTGGRNLHRIDQADPADLGLPGVIGVSEQAALRGRPAPTRPPSTTMWEMIEISG